MTFFLEHNLKKYILKNNIGNGATCKCYIGESLNEKNTEIYAIKIFEQKYYEFYSNEVSFLTKLNDNNNFIKLYDYGKGTLTSTIKDKDKNDDLEKQMVYYEVLEYANNGELKDYIKDDFPRIPENISAKIFMKIVIAVKYLHENNIAHCDLKPENILLDKNFNPRINDFGFSQEFDGKNGNYLLHKGSGTPIYSSPDIKHAFTKGYDGIKNDIFSLGVLLFVITIGEFPFQSATYSDDKYKFVIKSRFNQFWEFFNNVNISKEFKDLINNLISLNPTKRLSIDEILKHPWLVKHLGDKYKEMYNKISQKNYSFSEIDKEVFDELNLRKNYI